MLSLRRLLNLLKGKEKPPSKEDAERLKEALYGKVARLKKLSVSPEWKEYVELITEYIDQCRLCKMRYNFAHAYMTQDEKTFKHAAFLDNDIDFAQRLLSIPDDFIKDFEDAELEKKEREALENEDV